MSFIPTWDQVLPTVKDLSLKSVWKTIYLSIDVDDLQQEAWFIFEKCVNRNYIYQNENHFFGFFKTALNNRIIDLIKNKRLEKEAVLQYSLQNEEGETYLENMGESGDYSDFSTKLREAPEEIRQILTLLKKYPRELITLNRITNKRLCDLLGYDHTKRNLVNELKLYFRKGE